MNTTAVHGCPQRLFPQQRAIHMAIPVADNTWWTTMAMNINDGVQ